ncbi:hypothetical protein [Synechococcus sp. UW140]|uniref:hypothetical protein n=1 Tax=Synechococcus sp. UW140 TaxID=368503 RepID=UPI0025DAEEA2|nr:hypothetical protein [Synechococcus sp. UW140]
MAIQENLAIWRKRYLILLALELKIIGSSLTHTGIAKQVIGTLEQLRKRSLGP